MNIEIRGVQTTPNARIYYLIYADEQLVGDIHRHADGWKYLLAWSNPFSFPNSQIREIAVAAANKRNLLNLTERLLK